MDQNNPSYQRQQSGAKQGSFRNAQSFIIISRKVCRGDWLRHNATGEIIKRTPTRFPILEYRLGFND